MAAGVCLCPDSSLEGVSHCGPLPRPATQAGSPLTFFGPGFADCFSYPQRAPHTPRELSWVKACSCPSSLYAHEPTPGPCEMQAPFALTTWECVLPPRVLTPTRRSELLTPVPGPPPSRGADRGASVKITPLLLRDGKRRGDATSQVQFPKTPFHPRLPPLPWRGAARGSPQAPLGRPGPLLPARTSVASVKCWAFWSRRVPCPSRGLDIFPYTARCCRFFSSVWHQLTLEEGEEVGVSQAVRVEHRGTPLGCEV